MNRHGTNLLTNGTNCLRLPGRHYLPIQRRFERKRIEYSSANRKTMASNTTADDQSKRMYTIDIVIKLLQHVFPPCNKEVGDLLPDIGINSGRVTNMRGASDLSGSLLYITLIVTSRKHCSRVEIDRRVLQLQNLVVLF